MADNYILLRTEVNLGPCSRISASFSGMCFGVV